MSSVNAQCVPDTTNKIPGFYPAQFPDGYVNQPYSATTTVLSITDTVVFGQKVVIDSMVLNNVIGLPAGITHTCLNNSCVFLPKVHSCVLFSGTPTQSGTFPLKLAIKIYAKVMGTLPYTRVDTIKSYSLTIIGANAVEGLTKEMYFIRPTVVDNHLEVFTSVVSNEMVNMGNTPAAFIVFDATGRKISVDFQKETFGFSANTSSLTPGVYWLRAGEFSAKFIKQ